MLTLFWILLSGKKRMFPRITFLFNKSVPEEVDQIIDYEHDNSMMFTADCQALFFRIHNPLNFMILRTSSASHLPQVHIWPWWDNSSLQLQPRRSFTFTARLRLAETAGASPSFYIHFTPILSFTAWCRVPVIFNFVGLILYIYFSSKWKMAI